MLHIRLLGVLQLSVDGTPLPPLPTQKASGLLGYLLLQPEKELSREHLAELFWPDRPRTNARRSLHTALWQIRSLLNSAINNSDKVMITTSSSVCWSNSPDIWVDVADFERLVHQSSPDDLQAAIDLYRGPFLSNVYEDWCLEERYRLEAYYLRALSKLIGMYLSDKRFSASMDVSRQLLKADALNEIAHRALMIANYHLGNRSLAIEQYYECERLLKRELDIEPSAETKDLFSSIQEEALAYDVPQTGKLPAAKSRAAENSGDGLVPTNFEQNEFFGRGEPYGQLINWWNRGSEMVGLIKGEPGVGKTRLAQEFVDQLRLMGVRTGWGRCIPIEESAPHHSLRMAIQNLLTSLPREVINAVPDWLASELSNLMPELASIFEVEIAGLINPPAQDRLFPAIGNLIGAICQKTAVLLIIDDINLASQSTINLVEYLVRFVQSSHDEKSQKFRLLATTNEIGVPPFHTVSILRMRRDNLLYEIVLEPLKEEDVIEWIATTSGTATNSDGLAKSLFNKTSGNPLYIKETLKALVDHGKLDIQRKTWAGAALEDGRLRIPLAESIKQLITGRLTPLSASALETAQAGAVIGLYFDVYELGVITGKSEELVLKDLTELVEAQIISVNAPPKKHDFEFSHVLIQQAIYEMIMPPARTIMHRKLARKLIEDQGERAAPRILYHYRKSKDLEAVIRWSLIAGKQALQLSDLQAAANILQNAEQIGLEIEVPTVTMVEIVHSLGETFARTREKEKIFHYARRYSEIAQQMNLPGWQEESAQWMRIAKAGTSELSRLSK